MNVQRDVYGHLMPASFRSVLTLPHPVYRIVVSSPPAVTNDPLAPHVHRTHTQITDTETTDFHGQRMENPR